MYSNDDDALGEKFGEKTKNKAENNEQSSDWDSVKDAEFTGEFGWGDGANMESLGNIEAAPEEALPAPERLAAGTFTDAELGQENLKNPEVSGAGQLANYGFDTASRVYGLGPVLKAITEIDETDTNSQNPLGAIYARLAPTQEDRKYLFHEIHKDRVEENQGTNDVEHESDKLLVGLAANGEFYDKLQYQENHEQTSIDAIRALRKVLEMLETSEKFADVRERAGEQGKDIIEYLTSSETTPTLSYLLSKINSEITEEEVEELVEELEEAATGEKDNDSSTEDAVSDSSGEIITGENSSTENNLANNETDGWSELQQMARNDETLDDFANKILQQNPNADWSEVSKMADRKQFPEK